MRLLLLLTFVFGTSFAFAKDGKVLHYCGDIQVKYGPKASTGPTHWVDSVDASSNEFWVEDVADSNKEYEVRLELHSEGGNFYVDDFENGSTLKILALGFGVDRGAFIGDSNDPIQCEFESPRGN